MEEYIKSLSKLPKKPKTIEKNKIEIKKEDYYFLNQFAILGIDSFMTGEVKKNGLKKIKEISNEVLRNG